MNNSITLSFTEAVQINPRVKLKKDKDYPFVDMKAIEPSYRSVTSSEQKIFKGSGSRFRVGDTLMARITPCLENGKIARYVSKIINNREFAFGSTEFIIIRGRENITDNGFAYYLTQWKEFQNFAIGQMTGSSGRQRVPVDSLAKFSVTLPPVPTQIAIAHILGSLDDKIELNCQINHTLEQMAQAIFKSWFIDFDPVVYNAVQAGNPVPDRLQPTADRYRSNPETQTLPPHILDLFPDRFEVSELDEIPAGWEAVTLSQLSQKPQYGFTASASAEPVGPKFLRIKDINKLDWIDWTVVPYCVIESINKEKYRLKRGDIVIARMADPGHGALIEESVDAVFASYLIRFRPLDRTYERYLQYWLRSYSYWALVRSHQSGSTRANLNAKVLSSFPILAPPQDVAASFKHYVEAIREKTVHNVQESNSLASLRDTLLPRLISGELRISDAEKILENVI